MKRLTLIILLFTLVSNIIYADSLEIKGKDLLLWDKFRIQFGGYKIRLYDKVSLKKSGNIYTVSSDTMYTLSGEKKKIKLDVSFIEKENGNINVKYRAEFNEKIELSKGFGMFYHNISNNSYEVTNHAISEVTSKDYIEGYNYISFPNEISFHFFNPLKQHMKFPSNGNYAFLEVIPHLKVRYQRQNPTQEDIRQIMDIGEVVEYSFTISRNKSITTPMLSPIPNGHTEASMIMWDEIPMGFEEKTFMTFTTPDKTGGVIHSRMLNLLEQIPYYKANILLTFDYFDGRLTPDMLDTSKGKEHYQIEGPFNIVNNPPDSFTTWLNDIENNNSYSWTSRVSLGLHALHHTNTTDGVIKSLKYHEFGYLDSNQTSRTMDKIFSSLNSISITEKSLKTMRFPGVRYREINWQETVARGIKLIDIGFSQDVNQEHNFSKSWGRGDSTSWGIKTALWTDYEIGNTTEKYEKYLNYLKRGIPLLIGGHPSETIGSSADDKYKFDFFKQALTNMKNETEDMVFLLPDSLAYFWDKLHTVSIDSTFQVANSVSYHLSGNFPDKMTIVIPEFFTTDSISVTGASIISINKKRVNNYIVLNAFTDNVILTVKSVKKENITPVEVVVSPNPTNSKSSMIFYSNGCKYIDYKVTTLTGVILHKGRINLTRDISALNVNFLLKNYYGVFLVYYTDEKGRNNSESFFRIKD